MLVKKLSFSTASTQFYFDASFGTVKKIAPQKTSVIITDANVFAAQPRLFVGWRTVVIKAGEQHKVQATVDGVVQQLIDLRCDRSTTLIGVGGGTVTDITGYIAATFLRGVEHMFVPTTLLAMVDAAIGGKNGVDVGLYKNMVGTIKQPQCIVYDSTLLRTLPQKEWSNGFAEIIKHAAIKSKTMFAELAVNNIAFYQKKNKALNVLVQQNALLKAKLVQRDEFEKGERRLLNFGHTLGHAIEQKYKLMHGEAVAIGMVAAASVSEQLLAFKHKEKLSAVITQYGLPTQKAYDKEDMLQRMLGDKKREGSMINYILLQQLGKGVQQAVSLQQLKQYL